ncbi:MAG: hypothetical protein WC979_01095 [Candidatus Pacearchaeota archaeon]|jgi:hypothetical protein|nr:hypothetical protein [Clostridia bacterium]
MKKFLNRKLYIIGNWFAMFGCWWKKLFNMKFDETVIPEGPYCYEPDFEKMNKKSADDYTYYTKHCPYSIYLGRWRGIPINGCSYLGMVTDDDVFADSCKACCVNDSYRYDDYNKLKTDD